MRLSIHSGDTLDWNAQGVEQLKNNVLNLLRTRKGEVPYLPCLGIDPDYLDLPGQAATAALAADIRQQLARYEPAATLVDLQLITDQSGDTVIQVEVEF